MEAYTNLGILKNEKGDTRGAISAFNCVIAIGTKYPRAYLLRGIITLEYGNKEVYEFLDDN